MLRATRELSQRGQRQPERRGHALNAEPKLRIVISSRTII
jgi:hypothetical protein